MKLHIPRDREAHNVIVVGATGTRKSSILLGFADQAIQRGWPCLFTDLKGGKSYVSEYYKPSEDYLINFADSRCARWMLHGPSFRKALKAGVKIAFGDDIGSMPWTEPIAAEFNRELEFGMTPMQAIQSATSNAADLLGKSNLLGSLQPGRYADIIAVSGNPLEDIRLLENVKFVMKEGRIYKQEP